MQGQQPWDELEGAQRSLIGLSGVMPGHQHYNRAAWGLARQGAASPGARLAVPLQNVQRLRLEVEVKRPTTRLPAGARLAYRHLPAVALPARQCIRLQRRLASVVSPAAGNCKPLCKLEGRYQVAMLRHSEHSIRHVGARSAARVLGSCTGRRTCHAAHP